MGEGLIQGGALVFLLIGIGFIAGSYGTLVGLGGAVILTPVLLLLFPQADPIVLTSVTMGVVFLNALSGTVSYISQKRIDYRNGIYFALATIPGTIIGVWTLQFISPKAFSVIFGLVLLIFAVIIWFRPLPKQIQTITNTPDGNKLENDNKGLNYNCNRPLGVALSFIISFIAGILGIGGGIMHMPMMLYVLSFPLHIATATSQFMLVFTGLAGTITHATAGTYMQSWQILLWIALGAIPGAQIGARLSKRINSIILVRLLVLGLVLAGLRLAVAGIGM
ncbi:MAG: sulfite exporter TauE/SafE family protein [Dehalococcoidia bacterium]|nr:sulfite exporter TauE/SafE family protein [Dehalococcoidia bacterium]